MRPLVSVIMSVYNGENYLSEAIQSILIQTYINFEFLIVDDHSSDRSLELLQEFSAKDPRIRVFSNKENFGLTKNLNFLVKQSRGELLCRMDDDDISSPDRLERQVGFFTDPKNQEVSVVGSSCLEINKAGKVLGKRIMPEKDLAIKKALLNYNPIVHSSVMIKKMALLAVNGYNEIYQTSQDYDLWFRLFSAGFCFYNFKEPLVQYRVDRSAKKRKSMKYRYCEFQIRKNGYRSLRLPLFQRWKIFIPLILGILPFPIFCFLRRFDPRRFCSMI